MDQVALATDDQQAASATLTERYCVVGQSLRKPPKGSASMIRAA
jgi:hypothetical protein